MAINNDLMELVNGCGVAKPTDASKLPVAQEHADLLSELGFKTAAANVARKLNPILKLAEIAAGKYIEITPSQIKFYLEKKAAEYNKRTIKPKVSDGTTNTISGVYGALLNRLGSERYDQLRMQMQAPAPTYFTTTSTPTSTSTVDFSSMQNVYHQAYGIAQERAQNVENIRVHTNDYSNGGEIGQYVWSEVAVESYAGIPPLNILRKFKAEKLKKIFDYFTIASVNAVKDPLLLGRVEGHDGRFFLGQWGDDVALDDLI